VIILVLHTAYAKAQLEIGMSLIPQYTNTIRTDDILGSETEYRKGKLNLSYGLIFGYRFKNTFAFNTGVFYNPQGIKEEKLNYGDYGTRFLNMKYDYIRVPIMAEFDIPDGSSLQFSLSSGIGFNFLLHAEDNLGSIANFIDGIVPQPYKRYNKFLLDYSASIGINYKLSQKVLLKAEINGAVGLRRVDKKQYGELNVHSKIISAGTNLSVMYLIGKD
jgi:hypothetical protein